MEAKNKGISSETKDVIEMLSRKLGGKKNKIMKTAEEILIEFGCPDVTFDENVTMYYPAILSAMEEYANARVGEAMRWRDPKEELPKDEQVLVKTDKDEILLVTYWVEKGDFVYWDAPVYNVIGWRPIE